MDGDEWIIEDHEVYCPDCESAGFMMLMIVDTDSEISVRDRLGWSCGSCGGGCEATDDDFNRWRKNHPLWKI